MGGNSIGSAFRVTTFGESHGPSLGVVIDGCPPGIVFDFEILAADMKRRRPGQSDIVTRRDEADIPKVQSGIMDGQTTGTPICIIIGNEDHRSKDYSNLKELFRPSHADFTYDQKYGIRDHRGGGRASARETVARVAAGSVAKMVLLQEGVLIHSYVKSVGDLTLTTDYNSLDLDRIDENDIRCPDPELATRMIELIKQVRKEGDTIGGTIFTIVRNCPIGLGEPVFDKLHADLGKAILSINACKGIAFGSGFGSKGMKGSEHNDRFILNERKVETVTNHSGGIQGGISNGMDIYFESVFKPVATIIKDQNTLNKDLENIAFKGGGRHDPCVLPRAVPIVDAMTAIILVDHLLRYRIIKNKK